MFFLTSILAEIHTHEHSESILKEAWELITDPAHAITEIFYSLMFEIILIPFILFLYRKMIKNKLAKQIHDEIDLEHGYENHRPINKSSCETDDRKNVSVSHEQFKLF